MKNIGTMMFAMLIATTAVLLPSRAAGQTVAVGDSVQELCLDLAGGGLLYFDLETNPTVVFDDDTVRVTTTEGTTTLHHKAVSRYRYRTRVASVAADSTVCESALPIVWNDSIFAESGTRTAILAAADGSDSSVTMTLHVVPTTYGEWAETIVENDLPHSYLHHTYTTDIEADTLMIASTEGCDSVVTYSLTVSRNVRVEIEETVCSNMLPTELHGITFDMAGTQDIVLTAASGADSTVSVTLGVREVSETTIDTSVLSAAMPIELWGTVYSEATDTTFVLTNAVGCDSVVHLHVAVMAMPAVEASADSTVCESALPVEWNGIVFAAAGTAQATLTAASGADSVLTMTLAVVAASETTIDTTVLSAAMPIELWGTVYSEATDTTFVLTNAVGCDSVVHLHVAVMAMPAVEASADSTVCESALPVEWNGIVFAAAGTAQTTLTATNGADSVLTMTLAVVAASETTIDTTVLSAAMPIELWGTVYSEATDTTFVLTNAMGCDSVVHLHVAVMAMPAVEASADSTVCESALPVEWNGIVFAAAGTAQATLTAASGADSVLTMTLAVVATAYATVTDTVDADEMPHTYEGISYDEGVTDVEVRLVSAAGCDSIVSYTLVVVERTPVDTIPDTPDVPTDTIPDVPDVPTDTIPDTPDEPTDPTGIDGADWPSTRVTMHDNTLHIEATRASRAILFGIDGRQVAEVSLEPGREATLPIDTLPTGVYMLNVGEKTYKIVKI